MAPAAASPAAAIAAVAARSRARPRCRAATAAPGAQEGGVGPPGAAPLSRSRPGGAGCAFIGFPSSSHRSLRARGRGILGAASDGPL